MIERSDGVKFAFVLVLLFAAHLVWTHRSSLGEVDRASLAASESWVKFVRGERSPTTWQRTKQGFDNNPPGYVLFVGAIALVVPGAEQQLACITAKANAGCSTDGLVAVLQGLQAVAAFAALALVFLIARGLAGSSEIAVLTVILFLFGSHLAKHSHYLRPLVLITLFVLAAVYALLQAHRRGTARWSALAGAALAVAGLFRPPLLPAVLLMAPLIAWAMHRRGASGLLHAAALFLGYAIIFGPVIAVCAWQFDEPMFALRRINTDLAQRAAYGRMSFGDALAAVLVWIPDLGRSIARLLLSQGVIDRLDDFGADGYLRQNMASILQVTWHSAGSLAGQSVLIVERYVVHDFGGYLMSLPALFLRGIWGTGSPVDLFGIFFFWPLLKRLRSTGRTAPFVLVFLAIGACVLAEALVSINQCFFNQYVLLLTSYAIAHVTGGIELPDMLKRVLLAAR